MTVTGRETRVAVIGAGIAGLAACKALADRDVAFACFETSDDVGGTWYFGNPNGRSAAYRSLHINISRRWAGFRDHPLPDGFPDFAHHSHIHAYLREFADTFDLRRRIRFRTTVERADRLPEGGWELTLSGAEKATADVLVVANGHHWAPMLPDPPFPGRFDGAAIHSHSYVDPTDPIDFRGKRVLIVGIGNSAADIASELSRRDVAERVVLSTRSGAWIVPRYVSGRPFDQIAVTRPQLPLAPQRLAGGLLVRLLNGHPTRFGLPRPDHRFLETEPTVSGELLHRLGCGDLTAKPDVAELRGDGVAFADGSEERFDAIVYATGYRVLLPFLDEKLVSAPGNVLPLYKRIFKPGIDDLAFIGFAEALPSHFLFDELQARLVAMWVDGEWALAPLEEMEAEIEADDRRFLGHFKPGPRHTMNHLLPVYERDMYKRVIPTGRRRARAARPRG